VADPDLELRGGGGVFCFASPLFFLLCFVGLAGGLSRPWGGGGGGVVLLALPAFIPSEIFSFFYPK